MKYNLICLLTSSTILVGCAALPAPFSYLSLGKTLTDAIAILNNKKTLTDEVVSDIVKKDCKTRNILEGQEYCVKTLKQLLQEHIDELLIDIQREKADIGT